MYIETKNNNLLSWADFPFNENAVKIDSTYTHTFDNEYKIENGIISYTHPIEVLQDAALPEIDVS